MALWQNRSSVDLHRHALARSWALGFLICLGGALLGERLGLFDFLELKTLDWRMRLRPAAAQNDAPFVKVQIDAASEEALGPFPWPRAYDVYRVLVFRLAELGCRGVFFVFDLPPTQEEADPWTDLPVPVYLIRRVEAVSDQSQTGPPWVLSYQPLPAAIAAGDPIAGPSLFPPSPEDGLRRAFQALVLRGPRRLPDWAIELRLLADARGLPLERLPLPLDANGRLWPILKEERLPTLSFLDVLNGSVPSEVVRDRWAIVGLPARSSYEQIRTPFGERSALEVRAALLQALWTDELLRPYGWRTLLLVLAGWVAAVGAGGVLATLLLPRLSWLPTVPLFGAALHGVVAIGALVLWGRWIPLAAFGLGGAVLGLVAVFRVHGFQMAQAERRLLQAEREAAFGIMAAQVRHEMRNILQSIQAPAEMIRRNFARGDPLRLAEHPERIAEEMETILHHVRRLAQVLEEELALLDPRRLQRTAHDLWGTLEEALKTLDEERARNGVRIVCEVPPQRGRAPHDPAKMRHVFLNLLRNALQAMPEGGELRLSYREGGRRRPFVEIGIHDSGPGIPAEELERLFRPFHTTKAQGLGLGLAIARRIVLAHEGELRLESRPGEGTRAVVRLPREE
ncbi:MAG: hypothetical protein KatS3mg115_0190 [Candidatus Poribacteria bacterium]|nr:MAG: hypothetical protein KatS3mg115_0190 [Candidatus Poribacteria bacterium]